MLCVCSPLQAIYPPLQVLHPPAAVCCCLLSAAEARLVAVSLWPGSKPPMNRTAGTVGSHCVAASIWGAGGEGGSASLLLGARATGGSPAGRVCSPCRAAATDRPPAPGLSSSPNCPRSPRSESASCSCSARTCPPPTATAATTAMATATATATAAPPPRSWPVNARLGLSQRAALVPQGERAPAAG